MRIFFKIITAPLVLVLTLVVAVSYFLLDLGGWVFSLAGGALAVMGIIMLVRGSGVYNGVGLLVMGFLVSPFGIPAIALALVEKLQDLKESLQGI